MAKRKRRTDTSAILYLLEQTAVFIDSIATIDQNIAELSMPPRTIYNDPKDRDSGEVFGTFKAEAEPARQDSHTYIRVMWCYDFEGEGELTHRITFTEFGEVRSSLERVITALKAKVRKEGHYGEKIKASN